MDYYLDASAAVDGDGSHTSPFKVLNGKTLAAYDRVWIRRTGLTLSVTDAIYTLPAVEGIELLGWPKVNEYGYTDRNLNLSAWDNDAEDYWAMGGFPTALNNPVGSNQAYVSRGRIFANPTTTYSNPLGVSSSITFHKCIIEYLAGINSWLIYMQATTDYLFFNECEFRATQGGGITKLFYGGLGSQNGDGQALSTKLKISNGKYIGACSVAATPWAMGFTEDWVFTNRFTTLTLEWSATTNLTSLNYVSSYSWSIFYRSSGSGTSIAEICFKFPSYWPATYLTHDSNNARVTGLGRAIFKLPKLAGWDRETATRYSTTHGSASDTKIVANEVSRLMLDFTHLSIYPYTPNTSVLYTTPAYVNSTNSALFFKRCITSVVTTHPAQYLTDTGHWRAVNQTASARPCNISHQGKSAMLLTTHSGYMAGMAGAATLSSPIVVGWFQDPFTHFFKQQLVPGNYRLTVYFADAVPSATPIITHREVVAKICSNGNDSYKLACKLIPDNSTWVGETGLTRSKIELLLTLTSVSLVKLRVLIGDPYTSDNYIYLSTHVLVETL